MLLNGVNGADAGMVESRSRTSFTQKTVEGRFVAGGGLLKELQSHAAAEFRVFGLVNQSHAPGAQLAQDSIMQDCLVDHRARMPRGAST